jgi:hypothetical protein
MVRPSISSAATAGSEAPARSRRRSISPDVAFRLFCDSQERWVALRAADVGSVKA